MTPSRATDPATETVDTPLEGGAPLGARLGVSERLAMAAALRNSEGLLWFLAICRRCGQDLGQPFRSEDERDTWAAKHIAATGHVVHLTLDGFADLPGLHLTGVITAVGTIDPDGSGDFRYVCPADECSISNGPYATAQLAVAAWRKHTPKDAK